MEGGWGMQEKDKRIVLPEDLQREMLDFFVKTSIPRKKSQSEKSHIDNSLLSDTKTDRSSQNGT